MGRLRIMVRGVEQCVRLISVIVLRVGAIQISDFAQCLVSKAAKIHSSRAVAGRRLEYGGHDAGVYHIRVLIPGSHECSKSCVELYPRLVFFNVLLSSRKPPDILPPRARSSSCSDGVSGSCDAEGNRECNPGFCRRLRLGGCIRNILLIEVILEGHVGCGTGTRGAAHLPQTYFVVSSELEWRPMA